MAESDLLEKLVSSLSLEERQTMLEKLRALSTLPAESLYPGAAASPPEPALEEQYAALPWYYRLYYFIVGIFKNRTSLQLFRDSRIDKLGRRIELEYPQFYDFPQGLLLKEFHRLLAGLKEDARFFFDALDASVNRDRGGFFAFLGSLEMTEIHRRLEEGTEPEKLRAANPAAADGELRQTALRVMEEALAGIAEAQRTLMYRHARSLHCLKELASFLYDRILLAFSGGEDPTCSAGVVKDMLSSFNNILFSLKDPPSLALLESLFVFILQERSMDAGFDRGQELPRLLNRAEKALVNIKNFNRRLPLTLILQCAYRDTAYRPRQISGGEDWYAVYRDYWRQYINSRFTAYLKDRRRRELGDACKVFFQGAEPLNLKHAALDEGDGGFPLNPSPSLSFLLSFYKLVFAPSVNASLMAVLADGEFLLKENHSELAGAYNELIKLGDAIQNFDEKIGDRGIYGERYAQARREMTSLPVKRRKLQLILDDAAEEGRQIIDRARSALNSIAKVLAGILRKDSEGRYDSLSNLSQMEAEIPNFYAILRETGGRLMEALKILDLAAALESESEKN
jgi:hypothetical protein